MKKNFSVNISGVIFQIDEDAFEKLNRYLDRLNSHFANTDGKSEIIADIEQRIAEMLMERLGEQNRVVTLAHIEEVIRTLGEPADFDETEPSPSSGQGQRSYRKRLYRDPDNKILGGLAGGMGAYFNTDPLWFRIAFIVITLLSAGFGLILYLILWLIVPEAKTTAEKLEMRGEEININNIERSIKEEMHDIRDRFSNWKRDGYRKKKDSAGRLIETIFQIFGTLFMVFFKFLAAVIGFAIVISGIALLIAILVPGFSFHGFPVYPDVSLVELLTSLTGNVTLAWFALAAVILAILLPLMGIIWGGIRILFGIRERNRKLGFGFGGLWLLTIVFLAVVSAITVNDFSKKGFSIENTPLLIAENDTLIIGLQSPENLLLPDEGGWRKPHHQIRIDDHGDMRIIGSPRIVFEHPVDDSATVTTLRRARGRSQQLANKRSGDIRIGVEQKDHALWIDRYFITKSDELFRNQRVSVTIPIAGGQVFRLHPSLQERYQLIQNFDPLWDETILDKPLMLKNGEVVPAQ